MLVYSGPNRDGTGEIVVSLAIATGNKKTGRVLTAWILPKEAYRDGLSPWRAVKAGFDAATCGACPRRSPASGGDGTCYTHAGGSQILTSGAAAHAKSIKRRFASELARPEYVAPVSQLFAVARTSGCDSMRLAAFGDSAALPGDVLSLLRSARDTAGLRSLAYSHGWREDPSVLADHMASVDTAEDIAVARDMGARYFRVTTDPTDKRDGEIWCPAAHRKDGSPVRTGEGASCARCGLCSGKKAQGRPNVVILDHGPKARKRRKRKGAR